MTIRSLCSWIIVAASLSAIGFSASAGQVLTADELNRLQIEQRRLITLRDAAVEELTQNEKKIEVYLAWARGEDPSVLKSQVVPAAGAALSGSATSIVLFKKYFPEFLTRLPVSVQRSLKTTPALIGALAAAWLARDYYEYRDNIAEVRHFALNKSNPSALDQYYSNLMQNRENLGQQIEAYTLAIDKIGLQTNIYK